MFLRAVEYSGSRLRGGSTRTQGAKYSIFEYSFFDFTAIYGLSGEANAFYLNPFKRKNLENPLYVQKQPPGGYRGQRTTFREFLIEIQRKNRT